MDCEMLQMIQRYMEPEVWATGPEEIALDAIREVGSSGITLVSSTRRTAMNTPSTRPL